MKLFLTGGFLGSGKTTAIVSACRQLLKENTKVAVITNDQGERQVDGAFIKSFAIPVREVANGCFCCNYAQLDEHIQSLMETGRPEVIFAESVGSCTDLIATIAKPLARFKPGLTVIISVFVDITLFASLTEGNFSFLLDENVRYIFNNQLLEADILIMNKADLLTAEQLDNVHNSLVSVFPGKKILYQNSLNEDDISRWLHTLKNFTPPVNRPSLSLDYDLYGDGESKLAWLDKSLYIATGNGKAVFIAEKIIRGIYRAIRQHNLPIGHLKFLVGTEEWTRKISFTMTSGDLTMSWDQGEADLLQMLINARIQTTPQFLDQLTAEVLNEISDAYACTIDVIHSAVFSPGFPRPTHRFR